MNKNKFADSAKQQLIN